MTSGVDKRNMGLAVCELQEKVQPEESGDAEILYLRGGDNTISDIMENDDGNHITHASDILLFFCS
jgi:hypothetical protein